jgi:hypothetical protein
MPPTTRELYRSANGDRWSLVRDDGKVQVLHEPNAASGGRPSRLELGDFLERDAYRPQHDELLRLIGTLVDNIDEGGIADPQPLRIMSRLQVDGQVVAEIEMADRLLDAASVGIGRLGRTTGFQAIVTDMSRRVRAPISIKLALEFPSPP